MVVNAAHKLSLTASGQELQKPLLDAYSALIAPGPRVTVAVPFAQDAKVVAATAHNP